MSLPHKSAIQTAQAPEAIGTYSQAILSGQLLFLSGQIPLDPATQTLIGTEIEPQIHQVFKNLHAVLQAAKMDFKNLVQLRVYLMDLNDFAAVNRIMLTYIPEPFPARAAIGVSALPKGALIEIEGIACNA